MKVELGYLVLKNFKGIKSLRIDFEGAATTIFGDNATGKTTIADAFRWLMFDKDSTDRKDFQIKTLNKNNNPIHGLDHSVTAELFINGKSKIFSKILKEKWQKKRGDADAVFTGHETSYSINDVPMKKSEYEKEISDLLEENLFKLITDPLYFSQTMKWGDRRSLLTKIIDGVTTSDVLNSTDELDDLSRLLIDMPITDLKKSIQAKKRKLNDDIKSIPIRIDECNNSIRPVDKTNLGSLLVSKQNEVRGIDERLQNSSKEDPSLIAKKVLLNEKRAKANVLMNEYNSFLHDESTRLSREIYRIKNKKTEAESELLRIKREITFRQSEIDKLKERTAHCRQAWFEEKAKEFVINDDFTCPTCRRLLDQSTIEARKQEMLENFNAHKASELESLSKTGKSHALEIKTIEETMKKSLAESQAMELSIEELSDELEQAVTNEIFHSELTKTNAFPEGYLELKKEIESLEKELSTPQEIGVDIPRLKNDKAVLLSEIDRIKADLNQDTRNNELLLRIKELESQERLLAQQLADLERQEFLCEKFTMKEAELLETKVNSKFRFVKFKLFSTLINGGIEPTCEALINGVPFSDANNAAKINAGIDIINAMSEFYDISAPIFIDNREAVNEIIPTTSQIINLVVSKDKELRIVNQQSSTKTRKVT